VGGFLHSYTYLFHHFLKVVTSPSQRLKKNKQFTIVRESFITKAFFSKTSDFKNIISTNNFHFKNYLLVVSRWFPLSPCPSHSNNLLLVVFATRANHTFSSLRASPYPKIQEERERFMLNTKLLPCVRKWACGG
jgi:hypothetical protein